MRGYSHAVSGLAIWGATTTPAVPLGQVIPALQGTWVDDFVLTTGLLEISPSTLLLGAILIPGAAMINDIDHHNGTIAHSLPKIGGILPSPTQIIARFVARISGGHRHGTHSLLGIAVFTLLAYLAMLFTLPINGREVALGSGLLALFLTAFTLKVFHVGKSSDWFVRWGVSAVIAGCVTWLFPSEWGVLPVIVGLGAFVHCLGDMLTKGGVPWLWPFKPSTPKIFQGTIVARFWQKNGWFAFPILGTTDSGKEKGLTREKTLTAVLSFYWFFTLWAYFAVNLLDF